MFRVLLFCTLIGFQLWAATATKAGVFGDEVERATDETQVVDEALGENGEGDGKFLAVPVPIVNPTLGLGLAAVGLYTFPSSGSADSKRRSTVGVVAGGTDNGSRFAGAGGKFYFVDDRYRVAIKAGYGDLEVDFYGIGGSGPLSDNPIALNLDGFFGDAAVQARIADNLYFGLAVSYLDSNVGVGAPIDVLPTLEASFKMVSVGAVLEFDTRDDTWFPVDGGRGVVELSRYDKAIGSDAEFMALEARYAHYWSLSSSLALASEVRFAHAGNGAPFFMFPSISIRGFPAGRYLDSTIAQIQGELRWKVQRGLGAVAFAGTGVAAPNLTSLDEGNGAYGFGAGLRYRISKIDKINIGVDIAYGGDDPAIYFRIGEAF